MGARTAGRARRAKWEHPRSDWWRDPFLQSLGGSCVLSGSDEWTPTPAVTGPLQEPDRPELLLPDNRGQAKAGRLPRRIAPTHGPATTSLAHPRDEAKARFPPSARTRHRLGVLDA